MDEVGLVVVTTIRGDGHPFNLLLLLNQVDDLLKLADPRKTLWPQADNFIELRDKMLLCDANRIRQVSNGQKLWRVLQLMLFWSLFGKQHPQITQITRIQTRIACSRFGPTPSVKSVESA